MWSPHIPVLHAILDVDVAARAGWTPVDLARAYLDGGAPLLQVRAKHLASGPLLDLCDEIVELAVRYDAGVIVNDRADLARMCRAAGVHVGQDDLPPAAARAAVGPDAIVGFSTHSIDQATAACAEPITYVAVGPVFGTTTKDTGYNAVGLELVAAVVRRCDPHPVVAIGGVTLENAMSVFEAGARGVAVISDLLTGGNPAPRVAAYLRRIGSRAC